MNNWYVCYLRFYPYYKPIDIAISHLSIMCPRAIHSTQWHTIAIEQNGCDEQNATTSVVVLIFRKILFPTRKSGGHKFYLNHVLFGKRLLPENSRMLSTRSHSFMLRIESICVFQINFVVIEYVCSKFKPTLKTLPCNALCVCVFFFFIG